MLPERVTSFFERLEPCAVKAASTVLRGRDGSDAVLLHDWCLNEYEKPANTQLAGDGARVLRGGSWRRSRDDSRVAYRIRLSIDQGRYNDVGFRVVCVRSPHI